MMRRTSLLGNDLERQRRLRGWTLAALAANVCLPAFGQSAARPPVLAAPQAEPGLGSGPGSAPGPVPTQARFVVVLDAAHGGDDPGGKLADEPEKTFTLAMSVRLRSLLGARGIQVVTTRESDASLDANRRAEIANHANAQACISLHATERGTGGHLVTSSLSTAAPSRIPAWKTAQAAWVTRSLALAGVVNSALQHAGIPVALARMALPAVDSMTCPALAIEIAPQRGQGNSVTADLDDEAYQAQVAESLAAALLEWKTEVRQP